MLMEQQEMAKRILRLEKQFQELQDSLEDSQLSQEDKKAIQAAQEDEQAGRLVDSKTLAQELGL